MKRAVAWLGIKANSRAVMTLLAIGGALGATAVFAVDRVAPLVSPGLSDSEYGEGYRRGQREAQMASDLAAADAVIRALKARLKVAEELAAMAPEDKRSELKKWDEFRRE